MNKLLKLGAMAGLLLLSASAYATVIQATYSVDTSDMDPGLKIQSADVSANPFTHNVAAGNSVTFDLFDIWTDENSLDGGLFSCGHDCDHMPISVDFGFLQPDVGNGTVTGETFGQFTGFLNIDQEGVLQWDGPLSFQYGPNNDGLINVALSDETFNEGLFGLDEGRGNGATVKATLSLVSDASAAAVPEPGALGLFGLALVMIGFAAQRRRANRMS